MCILDLFYNGSFDKNTPNRTHSIMDGLPNKIPLQAKAMHAGKYPTHSKHVFRLLLLPK